PYPMPRRIAAILVLLIALSFVVGQDANATVVSTSESEGASTLAIPIAFLIFGGIIIIGFFSNLIFETTMIPDPLILIAVGVILGPATNIVDPVIFQSLAPYFASLALAVILFDGGLNIKFAELLEGIPRATLLAIMNLIFSVIAVTLVLYAWGMPPLLGGLLGAMLGGTSSAIVIPLMGKVKTGEKTVTLLNLESAITDGLTVVTAIAIMNFMLMSVQPMAAGPQDRGPVMEAAHDVASGFSIGGMIGLLFGVLWLVISKHFAGHDFVYLLVVSLIFIVYSITEILQGTGAIGVLMYGLVLGNGREFAKIFRLKDVLYIDKDVKLFHREISFFVKVFFFVYLGVLISVPNLNAPDLMTELKPFILGFVISLAIIVVRYISVLISTKRSEFENEIRLITTMLPRGLAPAVLAQLPASYGLTKMEAFSGIELFSDIAFTVIILTILFCTIGVWFISRNGKKDEGNGSENKDVLDDHHDEGHDIFAKEHHTVQPSVGMPPPPPPPGSESGTEDGGRKGHVDTAEELHRLAQNEMHGKNAANELHRMAVAGSAQGHNEQYDTQKYQPQYPPQHHEEHHKTRKH
ncbi:MAG: cation:proton antiporter, partial [Candidatus Undinarchaeales archaeon]|nr:cation:proton antiporter [Candidatus Undinarchaeales archaeon]